MADQTINPVLPVTRTRDVLKKKKKPDDQNKKPKQSETEEQKQEKKGIIDTYA